MYFIAVRTVKPVSFRLSYVVHNEDYNDTLCNESQYISYLDGVFKYIIENYGGECRNNTIGGNLSLLNVSGLSTKKV